MARDTTHAASVFYARTGHTDSFLQLAAFGNIEGCDRTYMELLAEVNQVKIKRELPPKTEEQHKRWGQIMRLKRKRKEHHNGSMD